MLHKMLSKKSQEESRTDNQILFDIGQQERRTIVIKVKLVLTLLIPADLKSFQLDNYTIADVDF